MSRCCDTCPMAPTCDELDRFECEVGLHAWTGVTTDDDEWDECSLCGEVAT